MKKNIVAFLMIGLLTLPQCANNKTNTVYICNSKSAAKYHRNKNCKGLNDCKHDIKAMDIDSLPAKFKPCTICAK
jgi:hypothetical protein